MKSKNQLQPETEISKGHPAYNILVKAYDIMAEECHLSQIALDYASFPQTQGKPWRDPQSSKEISIWEDDYVANLMDWEDYCQLCDQELDEQIASLEAVRKSRKRREAIITKVLPLITFLSTGYLLTHFLIFLSRQ